MTTPSKPVHEQIEQKAAELGISYDTIFCALHILSQNKDLVNAIDYRMEMDDYIYRAIIKNETEKKKRQAEEDLLSADEHIQQQAEKNLSMLSRDELMTDPYYRAVLPILVKIAANDPILRLHADVAADIVLHLADFKRRHRATSVTEIIVTKCRNEIDALHNSNSMLA